jgi:two-component system nitrogen regulation sensor histidine kinase NtrY
MTDPRPHRPLARDTRLIAALVLAVLVVFVAVRLLERSADRLEGDITRGVLLFVLSYLNITLITAILFVLGRTLMKAWLEQRRGRLGSRFGTKLLATYIALTLIPIGLIFFLATSRLDRTIDRWFSTPAREVVERARAVEDAAERQIAARALGEARALQRLAATAEGLEPAISLDQLRQEEGVEALEIYRAGRRWAISSSDPALPPLPAETLAEAATKREALKIEVLPDGSRRVRGVRGEGESAWASSLRVSARDAAAMGAIASAWSEYKKLEVQKSAIKAADISRFLLVTLAIVFGVVWVGLTLSRRITGPISALAESTGRLRAGDLSARVNVVADDELGVLVDSFNRMAAGLQETQAALLRSNADLRDTNVRLEQERGLLATILGSVTTGVLAFDGRGEVTACNPAARSLLDLQGSVTAESLRARADLVPLCLLVEEARAGTFPAAPRELLRHGEEGERHLEMAVRPLEAIPGVEGTGLVLAVDDTTHVAREQKLAAWSEVARRVAHEIKNPLTPIRLSAERILRRFRAGDPELAHAVEGGTRTIVEEVDVLKGLVDEFARYARLPPMRPEPTDLPELARSAARLFEGVREGVRVAVDSRLPARTYSVDPDQIKRVLVNLVANAVEACGERGEITVTLRERTGGVVIEVSDTGRGIPAADRDKLFLPDFTTKGRGTGLGLAIVSRIVADHNGTIRVEDNRPRGARFIIELPAA